MADSHVAVPTSFVDTSLQFLNLTSVCLKRASDELGAHRDQQKRAASMRGDALNTLISSGLVPEASRKVAESMLASHAETLNLLKQAADVVAEMSAKEGAKQATDLGTGTNQSHGGGNGSGNVPGEYNSLSDPYVGGLTRYKKASDRALAGE